MDKFGHAKLCDFGATTEQELGVDWVGTPEYASPEAIENVFNSKFKKFHAPRATDDLFSLGLVMFFIGAGATAEELVKHYATVRTAVCSDESFQVLRRTRSLYGKFLRQYMGVCQSDLLKDRRQVRPRQFSLMFERNIAVRDVIFFSQLSVLQELIYRLQFSLSQHLLLALL